MFPCHSAHVGYMTVLSFKTTISETLAKLKKICVEVFDEEVNKLNAQYQEFKKHNRFETKEKIYYPNCVYTVSELCDKLRRKGWHCLLMSSTINSTIKQRTWLPRERAIQMLPSTLWINF